MSQLDITQGQSDATARNDLGGVVYLLSGTLPGRGPIPSAVFRWATTTFSGAVGAYEKFIGPPRRVQRGQSFILGDGPTNPAVRIPVYNLPFRHSESLVAALSDEAYGWEHATATLRVGYTKPGQDPVDLAEADWTPLVLEGFFGAPESITEDGFTVVLYSRGARRNQVVKVRRLPGADEAQSIDEKWAQKPVPILVGRPDNWIKLPVRSAGVRGFTVSGYSAGATTIQFRAITVGAEDLNNSGLFGAVPGMGRALMIHYRTPFYPVTDGTASFDDETQIFTVTLTSGLVASVPRGAYVQQHMFGANSYERKYRWVLAGHIAVSGGTNLDGHMGWLLPDGTVMPADPGRWPFEAFDGQSSSPLVSGEASYSEHPNPTFRDVTQIGMASFSAVSGGYFNPNVPVYFQTAGDVEVTQQPAFSTTAQQQLSTTNFPTGGTGDDNDKMRDGSEDTGAAFDPAETKSLTFNVAPSPFEVDDTVKSTLYVVCVGSFNFFLGGTGTVLGSVSSVPKGQYRFSQISPRDFDQYVRIVATGAGGTVYELWWEHDLATGIDMTRDQDVEISTASGEVGEVMQYAELVMRVPDYSLGMAGYVLSGSSYGAANPFRVDDTTLTGSHWIPYPSAVMASLQGLLLEAPEGDVARLDLAAYSGAHARYVAEDIRLNFYLEDPSRVWTELERQLALQSRSHFYYGPSGHEIHYAESGETLEASTVQQSFRLPGVPAANAVQGAGPLLSRTPVSEVINAVSLQWDRDYIERSYERAVDVENAASVAIHGRKADPRGDLAFWAHSPYTGHSTHNAEAVVSGIAAFLAERQAWAAMHFTFDTAWIAHGLDRGSIVRVTYKVAESVYRHVACEVEDITTSPIDTEKFTLTCRAIGPPQKGLEPAYTWADLFDVGETWPERITGTLDQWQNYWTVSGGS